MEAVNSLFVTVLVIMIMTFGTGLLFGGAKTGKKWVKQELKMLVNAGRWILKSILRIIASVCRWAYKKL